MAKPELPTAFLKFDNVDTVVCELGNFVDGKRSISDIRDAVSAEFGTHRAARGGRVLRTPREGRRHFDSLDLEN